MFRLRLFEIRLYYFNLESRSMNERALFNNGWLKIYLKVIKSCSLKGSCASMNIFKKISTPKKIILGIWQQCLNVNLTLKTWRKHLKFCIYGNKLELKTDIMLLLQYCM